MENGNVSAREIPYGGGEWRAALDLRDRELRRPLGLSVYDDPLDKEADDLHFAVFDGEALIAYACATPYGERARVRQVAVEPSRRGEGHGRRVMALAEQSLARRGFREIFLHARASAEGFYRHIGYEPRGERFEEVGIEHIEMFRALQACADAAPCAGEKSLPR